MRGFPEAPPDWLPYLNSTHPFPESTDAMQPLDWASGQLRAEPNGGWQPCGMDGVETAPVDPAELSEVAARALRVLLGAAHWLPLSCLRLAVLGSTHDSRRCAGSVLGLSRSPRRSNTLPPPGRRLLTGAGPPIPRSRPPLRPLQQGPAGAGPGVPV